LQTESYIGYERRQAIRIKFEKEGQLRSQGNSGQERIEVCGFVNLSEGGACLRVDSPYGANSELSVNFRLPGLLNIFVNATVKVVWCVRRPRESCYLLGVTFSSFNSLERNTLRAFIYTEAKKNNGFKNS
jgi:c-di-GMP-binding flagellar brake protein YcgR